MSTAAPAAPGSAPAAPVAPVAEAAPAAARTIKPIPPPPRLPGVMDDGPQDAAAPEAQAERARDAAGRFAKTAEGEPIVGKPQPKAVDAVEGEPVIPELPEAKPKIKLADREFDSMEAVEREYLGQMNRLKPTQQKLAHTETQLTKAAESARGWHSEAQRLQAEIEQLRAGSPAPAAQPEAPAAGVDWGLYAEIAKAANEAGEPWKAHQWLQEQTDALRARDAETLRQEIERLRDEAIENPRREAAEHAQLSQTAATLVTSMAAQTNPDGSPAFPEFRDPDQERAVGELWNSLGLDPRLALTPGGAVAAVALFRMARAMDIAPPVPTAAPPTPDPAALAAAGFDGGRPLFPSATERREMDPGTARLVAGLNSKELLRPGLGFEA